MNSRIKTWLVLSMGAAGTFAAQEPRLEITVLVYNYAAVPFQMLAQTKTETARIYHPGNIEIRWLDCPLSPKQVAQFPACQVPIGPTKVAVRILSQSMEEDLKEVPESYGFALFPKDGSLGTTANVFAYDAEQLAKHRGMRSTVILGIVVAHEIGHLLMGPGSHSNAGIMHFPWGQKELQMASQGLLLFTPAELKKIRTNVSSRNLARGAGR